MIRNEANNKRKEICKAFSYFGLRMHHNRKKYMKRVNVMVSDEAKIVLLRYKKEKCISTLDETVDKFIMEKSK